MEEKKKQTVVRVCVFTSICVCKYTPRHSGLYAGGMAGEIKEIELQPFNS